MKKNIFGTIAILGIAGITTYAFGFWESEPNVKEPQKNEQVEPYQITVRDLSQTGQTVFIEKVGRVHTSQDVPVIANAGGQVLRVEYEKGDRVQKGDVLARLSLEENAYDTALDTARNGVITAQNNLSDTKRETQKALSDAKRAHEKATQDLALNKKDNSEIISQAQENYTAANLDNPKSSASLELSKAQNEYEKAQSNYETILLNDTQTLNAHKNTLLNLKQKLVTHADSVLRTSDTWLGIRFDDNDDSVWQYLGARKTSTKQTARDAYRQLKNQMDDLQTLHIPESPDKEAINSFIEDYNTLLGYVQAVIDASDELLIHSVSTARVTDDMLSRFTSSNNSLESAHNTLESNFVSSKNSIQSFLGTYKQRQEIEKRQLNIAKKNLNILQTNLQTQMTQKKSALEKAKVAADKALNVAKNASENALANYKNAQDKKETAIQNAQKQLEDAKIHLLNAQRRAADTNIVAKASGELTQINIDPGQTVSQGTQIATIVGDEGKYVEVSLTKKQRDNIAKDTPVPVQINGVSETGSIGPVSNVASKTLQYSLRINLSQNSQAGPSTYVTSQVPLNLTGVYAPLNSVSPITRDEGLIYIYNTQNQAVSKQSVSLGKVYGNMIHILKHFEPHQNLIISDMGTYEDGQPIQVTQESNEQ